ncbi:urease-enhancing factor Lpp domain protein [Helicobacter pylori Hp H-34]|uniref:Urease-enhancing factor Lpp domain protein n=1 Tax=Helicobacter pylori Hp H-34 TaxID=992069 RepID=J0PBN7_HELPX|nr:urease-enhancing factor Lpp domain protein [Helicobacter pylori Hp H-34]
MKTIRNGVVVGVSLLGGCASVETRFDALCVACIKDAFIEKELCYTPKDSRLRTLETLILLIKPIPGSKGFFLKNILALLAHVG